MRLSDALLSRLYADPQDVTNEPRRQAYRRALEQANRGVRFNRRSWHLSTKAVALLFAFLAGATVGLWFAVEVMR